MLPQNTHNSHYSELWNNRLGFLPSIEALCAKHDLTFESFSLCTGGSNVVFQAGSSHIVKLFFPFHRQQFETERAVLPLVSGRLGVDTPQVVASGEHEGWPYIVMSKVHGTSLGTVWPMLDHAQRLTLMSELGALIARLHHVPLTGARFEIPLKWTQIVDRQLENLTQRHRSKGLSEHLLLQIPGFLDASLKMSALRRSDVLVSGDFTPEHILLSKTHNRWEIAGLIDFADTMIGPSEYEFGGPASFIIAGERGLLRAMLLSYGYRPNELTPKLRRLMMCFNLLHRFADFNVQIQIPNWQARFRNLDEIENEIWSFE
jgi:hygromycin-B 7''-O-kinase